jgi:hypothetical protein
VVPRKKNTLNQLKHAKEISFYSFSKIFHLNLKFTPKNVISS